MLIDPTRVVVFLHVVLFAYWLGTDLGVLITGTAANARDLTGNARDRLRQASALIDMGPRTCLVLMIPVGLTLATNWGLPIGTAGLLASWLVGLAWVWLVWMVHLRHGQPIGHRLWTVDLGLRIVATIGFIGFGAWCLAEGRPIDSKWLAVKILLFGILILLGVIVRLMLLLRPDRPATPAGEFVPVPFWNPLRITVFAIWGLVLAMAFLGIVKPF